MAIKTISGHKKVVNGKTIWVDTYGQEKPEGPDGLATSGDMGTNGHVAASSHPMADHDEYTAATEYTKSMKVGTTTAANETEQLVTKLYGDEDGLSVAERTRRFREANRLSKELQTLEDEASETLYSQVGDQPVDTPHGQVAASQGKPRDDWDEATLTAYISKTAQDPANQVDENGEKMSPERSVVNAAKALTTKGEWRNDGLRQERLDPSKYAAYDPKADEDGNPVFNLVASHEEASSTHEAGFRDTLSSRLKLTGKENTSQVAKRLVHIQKARLAARSSADAHSHKAAAKLGSGGAKGVPGVGHYEAKQDGSWKKWDHDAVYDDLASELETTAKKGGTVSDRFDVAAQRVAKVKRLKGAKTPLKKAGVMDQMHTTKPGKVRAKVI